MKPRGWGISHLVSSLQGGNPKAGSLKFMMASLQPSMDCAAVQCAHMLAPIMTTHRSRMLAVWEFF